MANVPSGQLAHHLSDRALTPILSSSQPTNNSQPPSQNQAQALSSLTTAAIAAFDTASRLGLGVPQRLMIETNSPGPMVLHSYLNPQSQRPHSRQAQIIDDDGRLIVEQVRDDLRPLTGSTDLDTPGRHREAGNTRSNGVLNGELEAEEDESDSTQSPPLLVVSVVAPSSAEASDARRTAARLERTGIELQRQWVRTQEGSQGSPAIWDGDDD